MIVRPIVRTGVVRPFLRKGVMAGFEPSRGGVPVVVGIWLLLTGAWSDTDTWDNTATWNDGV